MGGSVLLLPVTCHVAVGFAQQSLRAEVGVRLTRLLRLLTASAGLDETDRRLRGSEASNQACSANRRCGMEEVTIEA